MTFLRIEKLLYLLNFAGECGLEMLKGVLFDLDGTLLNRDESVMKFIGSQYDRLQHVVGHISKEAYVTRFIALDQRGYVWKDQVYQQMVKEFNITKITWEALLEDYLMEFKHHCIAFPNLISTLTAMQNSNLLLGIITNGKGQFQMDNIKTFGIDEYFHTILVSEWEGIKKPQPKCLGGH